MSRYTGPVNKISRRYGYSQLETNKEFNKGKRRTSAPGQHGAKKQKLSNYGLHLYEKQKLKYMYGLNERQLKNLFEKSMKMTGVAGENLFILLESRLDNIVYRMGIATTRRQARQIVNHGHVLVNGKKIDIPSYKVNVDDEISIKEKSQKNPFILEAVSNSKPKLFVEFDKKTLTGKYLRYPNRDELTNEIQESLVVEYYNK